MIYYEPEGLQAVIVTMEYICLDWIHSCRLYKSKIKKNKKKIRKERKEKVTTAHDQGESRTSLPRGRSPCTQLRWLDVCRAAQMGSWGDGCCQHTDQAVGRWSHCYSSRRHVQGTSGTSLRDAHRLNRGQYAYSALLATGNRGMFTLKFGSFFDTLRCF